MGKTGQVTSGGSRYLESLNTTTIGLDPADQATLALRCGWPSNTTRTVFKQVVISADDPAGGLVGRGNFESDFKWQAVFRPEGAHRPNLATITLIYPEVRTFGGPRPWLRVVFDVLTSRSYKLSGTASSPKLCPLRPGRWACSSQGNSIEPTSITTAGVLSDESLGCGGNMSHLDCRSEVNRNVAT
jgi:hypothetical protein